ncbi:hypothetical protein Tco_1130863 [Tanacetum coccineum]
MKLQTDSLQQKLNDQIYENNKLRTQLKGKFSESQMNHIGTSVNTKLSKLSTSGTKLYSVTSFPKSKVIPKVVEKNDLSKSFTSHLTTNKIIEKCTKVLATGLLKIKTEPINEYFKNNRDVHRDYPRVTKEHVATLQELLEQARALKPLDDHIGYAFKFAARIQELLVYVSASCPFTQSGNEKWAPATSHRKINKPYVDASRMKQTIRIRAKTKIFDDYYFLTTYAVSNKEDTAYQLMDFTRKRWCLLVTTQGMMSDDNDTKDGERSHTDSPTIMKCELKIGDEFLKILGDNAFNGMDGGEVTDHITKVLEITEWIKIPNIDKNELRLHVFLKSLSGDAEKWWNHEIKGNATA